MRMFLNWLNITVSTMLDILLCSHAPPTLGDGPSHPSHFHTAIITRTSQPLFAVIIGIDKYLSNEIRNLSGTVDGFLQETLGVPKDHIKNLHNKEVTGLTLEAAIEDLRYNTAVKDDTPMHIFFAGHGAETSGPFGLPNTNGKIEMLVPHDFDLSGSSNSERSQGILDMGLSHLLADLAAKKSDNIVVVLDCGHSGSDTRTDDNDPTFVVRRIDLPETYTVAQCLLHDIEWDVRTKGSGKSGLLSQVFLSACKHKHEAVERHPSALLSLLWEKGVDKLTYKDVITNMPDLPAQDLQCEGVHQSRPLFNSKVAGLAVYPIRPSSDTSDQYILEADEAHVITKDAHFIVFADRTVASALGTAVISHTNTFTPCEFFPRGSGDETPFRLAAPGYALQTRIGEDQDVRLFIEPDERLLAVLKQIADEMQPGNRGFRLVESRDDGPDLIIAAGGDVVHFEITDKLCRDHGLTHMPFGVDINDSDAIRRIVQRSADFYRHLLRSVNGSPLAGKVTLECMKLQATGEYTDDLLEVLMHDPGGHNLNVGGVIMVDVDEEAIYGFKITNTMSVSLYLSMFYFDVSDLSISSYYQPRSGNKNVDVSLPAGESLTIGYGASETVPHMYTLREGQDVDVGFLKLFFSTEYVDLSGIVQGSPFTDYRESTRLMPESKYLWDAMCIGVVQKKGLEAA